MWAYVQRTGELFAADGELVGVGYAGLAEDKNCPERDDVPNRGPLPRGRYTVQSPRSSTQHGPYVLRLDPDPANVMHGRAGFLIHGDSIAFPGSGSTGCLVLKRALREQIWNSGDHTLTVVADL